MAALTPPLFFSLGTALLLMACSPQGEAPAPPAQPESQEESQVSQDPKLLLQELLQRCHGPLQDLAHSQLHLQEAGSKDRGVAVILAADQRLRLSYPGGKVDLLVADKGWRHQGKQQAVDLDKNEVQKLQDLHALLGAMLLLPLYQAERVEQKSSKVFALMQKAGAVWRLELDEEGLPKILQGPAGKVSFLDYLHTGAGTILPKEVILGEQGRWQVKLNTSNLRLPADYWRNPNDKTSKATQQRIINGGQARPSKPVLQTLPAVQALRLADAKTWPERMQNLLQQFQALAAQGQSSADLPWWYEDQGKAFWAIPFMPEKDREYLPKDGQVIIQRPAQRVAVVYPPKGNMAEARRQGEAMLREFAKAQGLKPQGSLRVIPYVMPEKGAPSKEQLQALVIRVELPLH